MNVRSQPLVLASSKRMQVVDVDEFERTGYREPTGGGGGEKERGEFTMCEAG